ncbi:MAG: hypothetical protein XD60_1521 [Acetothermia bacterium 64_32]|nr:MAG: hypothetical protein XD60_1521 [Acetothermia bacterium 64_32]
MRSVTEVHEYERLAAEYRAQEAWGIPMSVREWYERRLAELRAELRRARHGRPLGEILVAMGAVDPKRLELALAEQKAEGGRRLLGEILLEKGWVDEDSLKLALKRQLSP